MPTLFLPAQGSSLPSPVVAVNIDRVLRVPSSALVLHRLPATSACCLLSASAELSPSHLVSLLAPPASSFCGRFFAQRIGMGGGRMGGPGMGGPGMGGPGMGGRGMPRGPWGGGPGMGMGGPGMGMGMGMGMNQGELWSHPAPAVFGVGCVVPFFCHGYVVACVVPCYVTAAACCCSTELCHCHVWYRARERLRDHKTPGEISTFFSRLLFIRRDPVRKAVRRSIRFNGVGERKVQASGVKRLVG